MKVLTVRRGLLEGTIHLKFQSEIVLGGFDLDDFKGRRLRLVPE